MSGESPNHGGGESPGDYRPQRMARPASRPPAPSRPGWGRPLVREHVYSDPRPAPAPPAPSSPYVDYGESPNGGGESPY